MITTIRRKAAAALVSSGLAAGALVTQAAPASAATFNVSPGQSIQAAINNAPAGSTIKVSPGTYHQNVWITKNSIKLEGTPGKTILRPPAKLKGPCAQPAEGETPPSAPGICVTGKIDFQTFTVISPVRNVRVTGFTVENFTADGILVVGGLNTTVQNNTLAGNSEYGVFALLSSGTSIVANTASGSDEAGIYVGGSPNATATIAQNRVFDNGIGIFIRSASHGTVASNIAVDNCVGMLFLEAPNSATHWTVAANQVNHNTKACEGNDEAPPLSGLGIFVIGGHDNTFQGNMVDGNAPGGFSVISGGIVLVEGSSGNTIAGNSAHGNVPADLFDGAGPNSYSGNNCDTSIPPGLCGTTTTT